MKPTELRIKDWLKVKVEYSLEPCRNAFTALPLRFSTASCAYTFGAMPTHSKRPAIVPTEQIKPDFITYLDSNIRVADGTRDDVCMANEWRTNGHRREYPASRFACKYRRLVIIDKKSKKISKFFTNSHS
jgi:hypothetical protein